MGTLEYKTIDNFLDENKFQDLKNILISENIAWFWKESMTTNDNYF